MAKQKGSPEVSTQAQLETEQAETDTPAPERKPFEEWAKAHGVAPYLVLATRVTLRWADGREMTEADFLKAVESVAKAPIGTSPRKE